jgi:deoxycytidylate deaminase
VGLSRGLEVALAAAELSTAPRVARRMGAALFVGPRLLSIGYNRWHTHPQSDNGEFCRTLHAEHTALLRRQHYDPLKGNLTLYVGRRLANGAVGNSEPCNNCIKLSKVAGVKRIVYFNKTGQPAVLTL